MVVQHMALDLILLVCLHVLLKLILAIEAFATFITTVAALPMRIFVSLHVGPSLERSAAGRARVLFGAGDRCLVWIDRTGRLRRRGRRLNGAATGVVIASIQVAVDAIDSVTAGPV